MESFRELRPLFKAAREGRADEIRRLLSEGVDPNSLDEICEYKQRPLCAAVQAQQYEAVKALLEGGAKVSDTCGLWKKTPLLLAVDRENQPIIRLLLDYGADINQPGEWGEAPLHIATQHNNWDLINLFLELGADPNLRDRKWGQNSLCTAVKKGLLDVVELMVENYGGDVEASCGLTGAYLLLIAGLADHSDVVAYLLEKGMDPFFRGEGYTKTTREYIRDAGKWRIVRQLDQWIEQYPEGRKHIPKPQVVGAAIQSESTNENEATNEVQESIAEENSSRIQSDSSNYTTATNDAQVDSSEVEDAIEKAPASINQTHVHSMSDSRPMEWMQITTQSTNANQSEPTPAAPIPAPNLQPMSSWVDLMVSISEGSDMRPMAGVVPIAEPIGSKSVEGGNVGDTSAYMDGWSVLVALFAVLAFLLVRGSTKRVTVSAPKKMPEATHVDTPTRDMTPRPSSMACGGD